MRVAAAFLLALLIAGVAQAPAMAECLITDKAAPKSAPRFATSPAPTWHGRAKTAVITGRSAQLFRTQLREQSKASPDFAGHYRIAQWGCGAGCVDWAVIDSRTGKVAFTEAWRGWSGVQTQDDVLVYRRDSRLLILEGSASEHPADDNTGLTYLLWASKGFKKLAFYPLEKACRETNP